MNTLKKVLLVVDMQKDFMHGGALGLPFQTEQFEREVADYIKDFDGYVFTTQDLHDKVDIEFQLFPDHCIRDTEGQKLCDAVEEAMANKKGIIGRLHKKSYTDHEIIRHLANLAHDKELYVVGVCTHICVHDLIADYVNHAKRTWNQMPKVIVPVHLVKDFDKSYADFALGRLEKLYGVKLED